MTPTPCAFCGLSPAARRGACWTCRRKLDAGELLPPARPGPAPAPPADHVAAFARALTPDARERLLAALLAPPPPAPSPAPSGPSRTVRRDG
jgi:hypothetical protein